MPLNCQKEKEKENKKKRNIKSGKINERKRKMLVSKYTITLFGELSSATWFVKINLLVVEIQAE